MEKSRTIVLVASLALLAGSVAAGAATPAERQAYKAALARAASDYQAARAPCGKLAGTAKSVCYEEARAARVRDESLAAAKYRNSPRARADAEIAIAKADYAVAKKKCGASAGSERTSCLKSAREVQGSAVEDALKKKGKRTP